MVTRRALLISGPGDEGSENYLRGALLDVGNYQRHLLSSQGGAWEPEEIEVLHSPTVGNVRVWLSLNKSHDYTFVMFSGHGSYSLYDSDQVLELRRGERIAGAELRTTFQRRTVIMDSCQVLEKGPLAKAVLSEGLRASFQQRVPDREMCRRKFWSEMDSTPNAVVALHSCAKGELSYEDDQTGGYYNSSVLISANEWVRGRSGVYDGSSALSVISTHIAAEPKTIERSGNRQHPSIVERPKSGTSFPFAVFA